MSERLTVTMAMILLSEQEFFFSWQHTIRTRFGRLEVRRPSLEALVERGYLMKQPVDTKHGLDIFRYYRIPTVVPRQAYMVCSGYCV